MIIDILIEPINGEFDPRLIADRLAETPYVARDEHDDNKFMMFDNVEDARKALIERRADPSRFPMTAILIKVNPDRIGVYYRTSDIEPARAFVNWLSSKYQLQYFDEANNELTPFVDSELDLLFGRLR